MNKTNPSTKKPTYSDKSVSNKKDFEQERDALWALSLSEALSPRHVDIYQKCFEGYSKVIKLSPQKIRSIGLVKPKKTFEGHYVLFNKLEEVKNKCHLLGIKTVTLLDKDYPPGLREIFQPPMVLYYKGQLRKYYPSKHGSYLAIVGTRRCDTLAETVTYNLAREFTSLGGHIVSGMAIGIDTQAHRGALDGLSKRIGKSKTMSENVGTTAVLGCGVDTPYPWGNRKLYERIIDSGGAIISEYIPGTPPLSFNFPQRNRIISGLAEGVIITQAPIKSGALITVDFALDQGRTVYAYDYKEDINGNIPERNAGNYRLIKEGAKPVTSFNDLFDHEFEFLKKKLEKREAPTLDYLSDNDTLAKIYRELRNGPRTLTQLSHALKQETETLIPVLMEEVISGNIREMAGKKYFLG